MFLTIYEIFISIVKCKYIIRLGTNRSVKRFDANIEINGRALKKVKKIKYLYLNIICYV